MLGEGVCHVMLSTADSVQFDWISGVAAEEKL